IPNSPLIDDVIRRGFELAYFIHGDKPTAIDVVTEAAEKLDVAMVAQDKRLYYHPKRVTKVSLSRLHLFQRLIYVTSEKYERQTESRNDVPLDQRAMVVRFIKHLVRITLKRNSFYVALGVGRILHNYTTAEAMRMYDLVQDPERGRDDCYYRSRKSILMRELIDRFGDSLRICRAAHGEERFASVRSPSRYIDRVRQSLEMFTPWKTPCPVAGFAPSASPRAIDLEDEEEIKRMHAILHPPCFESLIRFLGLTPPDCRLDVPVFAVAEDHGDDSRPGDDGNSRLLPPDVQEIRARLAGGVSRRQQMSSQVVRIVADGVDRARLELRQRASAHFEIDCGAEGIEVRSGYGQAETVLALFLLPYRGDRLMSCDAARTLESGDRLRLRVSASESGASIDVQCHAVRARRMLEWLTGRQRALAWVMGTATVVALSAWLVVDRQNVVPHRRAPVSAVVTATSRQPAAPSAAVETVAEYDRTRAAHLGDRESSVASVSAIYLDVAGDTESAGALRKAIAAGIPIVEAENASSALKLFIHESADGNLTVDAKLVDVNGRVLWPEDGAKRTYRGRTAAAIAKQVIDDLSAARR